jgi:hypothetical protein
MSRVPLRFRLLSIASTAAFFGGAVPAWAQPTPAAPSPVAVPYPETSTPETPTTQGGGKLPTHKHLAGVKYEDRTTSGDAPVIEAQSLSWGKLEGAGPVTSADPMEGGQIAARTYQPGKPTYGNLTTVNSADPMEGGQIARAATGDLGKLEAANMVAEPVARTTATFKTLAGACTNGVHYKEVKITTRSGGFALHNATVISVTPADPVDGQAMEEVTLSYASVDN